MYRYYRLLLRFEQIFLQCERESTTIRKDMENAGSLPQGVPRPEPKNGRSGGPSPEDFAAAKESVARHFGLGQGTESPVTRADADQALADFPKTQSVGTGATDGDRVSDALDRVLQEPPSPEPLQGPEATQVDWEKMGIQDRLP